MSDIYYGHRRTAAVGAFALCAHDGGVPLVLLILLLAGLTAAPAAERDLLDRSNRFLDGGVDASKARIRPSVTILDSFEDEALTKVRWRPNQVAIEVVAEHATDGAHALKVTFPHAKAGLQYAYGGGGWGAPEAERATATSLLVADNDRMEFDVFNPEDHDLALTITTSKPFAFVLKPGKNTLGMDTQPMIDAVYRSTMVLWSTTLRVETAKPATLYIDHVRFIGPGLGENLIASAKCFDCCRSCPENLRPYFLELGSKQGYDATLGYGWQKPSDVEFSHGISKMMAQESSGRMPHDQLMRDCVLRIDSPLIVDLPDGRYRMHWVDGPVWKNAQSSPQCDYSLSVKVGDRVIPIRTGARDFNERLCWFYGNDRVDYLLGDDDKWTYLRSQYYPLECDVEVTGGKLAVEFLTDPPGRANLVFLIIYPVDKAPVIEPELAALWQDMRKRFNAKIYPPVPKDVAVAMNLPGLHPEMLDPETAREYSRQLAVGASGRDLVVFRRETSDDVFPDTVPAATDLTDEVSADAPAGEIASLAINLHALRDLAEVRVVCGDFAGPKGTTIAADRCDLRFVRYDYRASGQQTHGDWTTLVMPWYLVKREAIALRAGMSARYWLNVDVPQDSAPGDYQATATIRCGASPETKVRLRIVVLPFRLDGVPPAIEFSAVWGARQHWSPTPDASFWTLTDRMDAARKATWDKALESAFLARAGAEFRLMKRYGLNLVYERNDLRFATGHAIDLPADIAALLPRVPVAKIDGRSYIGASGRTPLQDVCERAVADARKGGTLPVLFGPPKAWSTVQEEAGIYRFTSGFLLWRIGAGGCVYDPWNCYWGDPYHPFDSHSGEWGSLCTPASHDWPTLNSSVELEGIREGIVDYRYLVTLERLIAERKGSPVAADAQRALDALRDAIVPDATEYYVGVGNNGGHDHTWHQKPSCWSGLRYREARAAIAEQIVRLQQK
jgi:hypothetical protein